MMGRTRSRSRAGWPPNLYPNREGFKYRNPVTRKEFSMGRDFAKAKAAAKTLNAMLTPGADLVAHVMGGSETVNDAIAVFRRDEVPNRKWAPKTAENYESVIRRIALGIGDRALDGYTVKDCAAFIRAVTESPRSRQQFRLVLSWIFASAIREGWMDDNPALITSRFTHDRARDRLTIEAYHAIWQEAPQWTRNAMDLSLLTLLRRDDVVSLRFADAHDGALWVVPKKTKRTTGNRLRIGMGPDLDALLSRARDAVVSPYVIHRLPGKARPSDQRAKDRTHHTQVLPEQLSRAFQDARDKAGITGENPPTFHEIRSLGGALLQDAGWTLAQVQALMGHSSETMTKVYLDGHDTPWTEVAGVGTLPRK